MITNKQIQEIFMRHSENGIWINPDQRNEAVKECCKLHYNTENSKRDIAYAKNKAIQFVEYINKQPLWNDADGSLSSLYDKFIERK